MQIPSRHLCVYKVCDVNPVYTDVTCIGSHHQKNMAHNPGEAGKADHNEDVGALSVFLFPHLGQGVSSLLVSVVDVLWDSNVVSFDVKIYGQDHPGYEKS